MGCPLGTPYPMQVKQRGVGDLQAVVQLPPPLSTRRCFLLQDAAPWLGWVLTSPFSAPAYALGLEVLLEGRWSWRGGSVRGSYCP